MIRLLFDVNLILDVLLDRRPHAADASRLWSEIEQGRAEGVLSAHAVTTIHDLNARATNASMADEATEALLSVFGVAAVDEHVLREASGMAWRDYEDAVTAAAARRANCDALVTRNPRDFAGSRVRVLMPAEAIAWLKTAARRS